MKKKKTSSTLLGLASRALEIRHTKGRLQRGNFLLGMHVEDFREEEVGWGLHALCR